MIRDGMGVMISMFSGDYGEEDAKKVMGKIITKIEFSEDALYLYFDSGRLKVWDDGQSCCEHRYMHTDDTLDYYVGANFIGLDVADAPDIYDEWGDVHEIQFLNIRTSKGGFTIETHNEHNGYYGGFAVKCLYFENEATND